jgi:hypothetical protein
LIEESAQDAQRVEPPHRRCRDDVAITRDTIDQAKHLTLFTAERTRSNAFTSQRHPIEIDEPSRVVDGDALT